MKTNLAQSSHLAPDQPALAVASVALDTVPLDVTYRVAHITAPPEAPEWAQWLADLGFLEGEWVTVTTRGLPGGDPLVVRVGISTFAIRRAEAACIAVLPLAAEA